MIERDERLRSPPPATPSMNERSIFSMSTGKRRQVGERRVAGAEVVDGQPHAERVQRLEARDGELDVAIITLSVSSSTRREGASPLRRERVAHVVEQVRRAQLARREVDRHGDGTLRRRRVQPARCAHASRRTQRPSSTIRPVSSASGMNSAGARCRASGWRQRSSASTPTIVPVAQVDDRLVGERAARRRRSARAELAPRARARSIAAACMPGSKIAQRPLPLRPWPRYIATSASRSSSSARRRRRGAKRDADAGRARDARARRRRTAREHGGDQRARPTATAARPSPRSSSRTANSSPPSRATVSPAAQRPLEACADRDQQRVARGVAEACR